MNIDFEKIKGLAACDPNVANFLASLSGMDQGSSVSEQLLSSHPRGVDPRSLSSSSHQSEVPSLPSSSTNGIGQPPLRRENTGGVINGTHQSGNVGLFTSTGHATQQQVGQPGLLNSTQLPPSVQHSIRQCDAAQNLPSDQQTSFPNWATSQTSQCPGGTTSSMTAGPLMMTTTQQPPVASWTSQLHSNPLSQLTGGIVGGPMMAASTYHLPVPPWTQLSGQAHPYPQWVGGSGSGIPAGSTMMPTNQQQPSTIWTQSLNPSQPQMKRHTPMAQSAQQQGQNCLPPVSGGASFTTADGLDWIDKKQSSRLVRGKKKDQAFDTHRRSKSKKDDPPEELKITTMLLPGAQPTSLPPPGKEVKLRKKGFCRAVKWEYLSTDSASIIMDKCRKAHYPLLPEEGMYRISSFGMYLRGGKGNSLKLRSAEEGVDEATILDGVQLKKVKHTVVYLAKREENETFRPITILSGVKVYCGKCANYWDQVVIGSHPCKPCLDSTHGQDSSASSSMEGKNNEIPSFVDDPPPQIDDNEDDLLKHALNLSQLEADGSGENDDSNSSTLALTGQEDFFASTLSNRSSLDRVPLESNPISQSMNSLPLLYPPLEYPPLHSLLNSTPSNEESLPIIQEVTPSERTVSNAQNLPSRSNTSCSTQEVPLSDEERLKNRGSEKLSLFLIGLAGDNMVPEAVQETNFLRVKRNSLMPDFIQAYRTDKFQARILFRLRFQFEGEPVDDYGGGRREFFAAMLGECEDQLEYLMKAYKNPKKYDIFDQEDPLSPSSLYFRLKAFGAIAALAITQESICEPWVLNTVLMLQKEKDLRHPFIRGLEDPFQLVNLILRSSAIRALFVPSIWDQDQLLRAFVRDPEDVEEDWMDASLAAIKESIFEAFQRFLIDVAGGMVPIQRDGVTRPATGSDVWKFCTGSVSLSAEHSENVVKVRFSEELNVFCYPYARTCDKILFLPLSLKLLNFKSGWITALEHGIVFSNA